MNHETRMIEEGYRSQLKLLLMQLGPQREALAAQLAAVERQIADVTAELSDLEPAKRAAVQQPAKGKKSRN